MKKGKSTLPNSPILVQVYFGNHKNPVVQEVQLNSSYVKSASIAYSRYLN